MHCKNEAKKDYSAMRSFQTQFIEADQEHEKFQLESERLIEHIAQACENAHALIRERPEKQWTFCEVETLLDSIGNATGKVEKKLPIDKTK